MSDQLTQKIKEELRKKGKIATDSQISEVLSSYNQNTFTSLTTPQITLPSERIGADTDTEGIDNLGLLNAVGVGLYTALDTGLFGLPGFVLDRTGVDLEDIGLDLEQEGTAATIARAGGGIFGFLGGAPLKVGMGASRLAVRGLQKAGVKSLQNKQLSADVAKKIRTEIVEAGGSSKIAKQLSKQYKGSVQNANIRWETYRPKFAESTKNQLLNTLKSVDDDVLSLSQKKSIQNVIEKNITDMPVQDIMSLMKLRFGAKTKRQLWLARTANDAVAFGTTDVIFEGVRQATTGDYSTIDIAAAVGTGIAAGTVFGIADILPAAGKPKGTFKRDLVMGMRSAFRKAPFKNYDDKQLLSTARFYGESKSANAGEPVLDRITIGGKTISVDLSNPNLKEKLDAEFPSGWSDGLKQHLTKERTKFGRETIKFALGEEAQSLQQQWKGLLISGAAFNQHHFVNMLGDLVIPGRDNFELANIDKTEFVTNFLIGAWLQRGSRPLTKEFDFNQKRADRLRTNLGALNIDLNGIDYLPSLHAEPSRLENTNNIDDFKGLIKELKNRNITSDNDIDITEIRLSEEAESASLEGTPLFAEFLRNTDKKFARKLENISVEDAKYFEKELKKLKINSPEELNNYIDERLYETTKDFDTIIDDVITLVEQSDGSSKLKLNYIRNDKKNSFVPEYINIDESFIKKVEDGDVAFLEKDGEQLSGAEAVDALTKGIEGFNTLLKLKTRIYNDVNINKDINDKRITLGADDEVLIKNIYTSVLDGESKVNNRYPTVSNKQIPFTFLESQADYVPVLLNNKTVELSESYRLLFSKESPVKDELQNYLLQAGILVKKPNEIGYAIVNDIDNIKLDGDETVNADNRRFLSRIHALQRFSLGYDVAENVSNRTIETQDVDALRKFLDTQGYKETLPNWIYNELLGKILQKQASKMNLSINEVDSIIQLIDTPFAKFTSKAVGDVGGFIIAKIDIESPLYAENSSLINEYNAQVDRLISESKGVLKGGRKHYLTSLEDLNIAHSTLVKNLKDDTSSSALEAVSAFLNAIGNTRKNINARTKVFLETNANNANILSKWLLGTGVVKYRKNTKSQSNYEVDVKLIDKNIEKELLDLYQKRGVTEDYIETIYEESRQYVQDKLYESPDVVKSDRAITLEQFFEKYRFSEKQQTFETQQNQNDFFNGKFKIGEEYTTDDLVLKSVFDELYIEDNGKYVLAKSLTGKKARTVYNDFRKDIIGLVQVKSEQREVQVIKFNNQNIKADKQIIYNNDFHNFLTNDLGITYAIVNPISVKYTGWSRVNRNMFTDADLPEQVAKLNRNERDVFISALSTEKQMEVLVISQDADPIAIRKDQLDLLYEPFKSFAEKYSNDKNISKNVTDVINDLNTKILEEQRLTSAEHETMARLLIVENMLVKKDGSESFYKILNSEGNVEKTLARFKLYNSKKFVRPNANIIDNAITLYGSRLQDKQTLNALTKYKRKKGFKVAIWNDEAYDTVIKETQEQAEKDGIQWDGSRLLNSSFNEVSAYDSISFVSKDLMRLFHTLIGHNPNSLNPIKPVISSDSQSALLYGKTLFVYDTGMQKFFDSNPQLDIVLAKSGAKIFNDDASMINSSIKDIAEGNIKLTNEQIKDISLESIGVLPNKDTMLSLASKSISEHNYKNNEEEGETYRQEYEDGLIDALNTMEQIYKDPQRIREFMISQDTGLGVPIDADGSSSLSYLHANSYYNSLTRDANPLYFNKRQVWNKLYNHFIDGLLTTKRSVVRDVDGEDFRYGGQAYLSQSINNRLKGTLTDANGKIIPRGEILLPSVEKDSMLKNLVDEGYTISIIDNSNKQSKILRFDDFIKIVEDETNAPFKEIKDNLQSSSLGNLHNYVKGFADTFDKKLQIGIVVSRKPRTRPNDMAMLGLAGFLDEADGHRAQINSLDVMNVFEGDYDADKADYFFANRKETVDHVERTSEFFVQGIDPSVYQRSKNTFSFSQNPTRQSENMRSLLGMNYAWKNAIGKVQKTPRTLNYLDKLASETTPDYIPTTKRDDGVEYRPKTLLQYGKGEDVKSIVLDFDNMDFYVRNALVTQYMIDNTKNLNKTLGEDLVQISDEYLFPEIEKSFTPNELTSERKKQVYNEGSSGNKKIRIFRKYGKDGNEVDLNAVDKKIIKTLMSEYSKLLNVTGGMTYDNTGTQRKARYEDILETSKEFFDFNNDLNNKIYYKLRRQKIDGKQIFKMKEFNDIFDVKEQTYTTKDNKEKKYYEPTANIFDDTVIAHGKEFSNGSRGAVIDRALNRISQKDVFESSTPNELSTGQVRSDFDNWYTQLTEPEGRLGFDDVARDYELTYSDEILNEMKDVNKSIGFIKRNTYYRNRLFYKKGLNYKEKQRRIKYFNNLIESEKKKINTFINSSKFNKTGKLSDLEYLQYVPIDSKDVRESQVQHAVMASIKNALSFGTDFNTIPLSEDGRNILKDIKTLRKNFYSHHNNNLKDFLGSNRIALDSKTSEYLSRFPEESDLYNIEEKLIDKGIGQDGVRFLFAYMEPNYNPNGVGVFEGRIVPMPRYTSARFRNGLRYLTKNAMSESTDPFLQELQKKNDMSFNDVLRITQGYINYFDNFYNTRIDRRNVIDKSFNAEEQSLIQSAKLPGFSKHLDERVLDFGGINWGRTKSTLTTGKTLTNNHLIDLYMDILQLAGKTNEFVEYYDIMGKLQSDMLNGNIIDPFRYLAIKSQLDPEVKRTAQKVLSSTVMEDANNPIVQKIKDNPIYKLMGGASFFKNLSFEKLPEQSMKDLKLINEALDYRTGDDLPVSSSRETMSRAERFIKDNLESCLIT